MVTSVKSQYPHVEWFDLQDDGTLVECLVMKRDNTGNVYFIEIAKLDAIDRGRALQIISDRNADNFELWDLMANKALNNGANALEYFHQLVKVITLSGKIINPQLGRIGAGSVKIPLTAAQKAAQQAARVEAVEAAMAEPSPFGSAEVESARPVKRK